MAEQNPPRLAGGERAVVLALLQYQRDSLIRKMSGVNEAGARSSPVPSGTSLLWLTNHMADAERTWVLRRFAGRPSAEDDPGDADILRELLDGSTGR